MLSDHLQIPTGSTGAMLRQERTAGSDLGREADAYTAEGKLFPDTIALKVVERWLEENGDRFILDGFPRTVGQARAFDQMLTRRGGEVDAVIALQLPRTEIERRVLSRLTCEDCGATFSTSLHNVAEGGECPKCGGRLGRRKDDTLEALDQRLQQHTTLSQPVEAHYAAQGKLVSIDVSAGVESAFQEVLNQLEGRAA